MSEKINGFIFQTDTRLSNETAELSMRRCLCLFGLAMICCLGKASELSAQIAAGSITNSNNRHVYYLLTPTDTAAADIEAMSLGGHLATIRNIDENAWIVATFNPLSQTNNLFIGFTDRPSEGKFTWMSGETNAFTNWKSGEPNNTGGKEDYTEIIVSTGKWNDIPGASHYSMAEIPLRLTNNFPVVTIRKTNNTTVELSWTSISNQLDQILWTPSLGTTNAWSTLGTYLYGNGATLTRTNMIDETYKFYQVVPIQ